MDIGSFRLYRSQVYARLSLSTILENYKGAIAHDAISSKVKVEIAECIINTDAIQAIIDHHIRIAAMCVYVGMNYFPQCTFKDVQSFLEKIDKWISGVDID